jgi:hypothetical protein
MQHGVTNTRDGRLLKAAEFAEHEGAGVGSVLRSSRLDLWEDTDWWHVQELSLVMDEDIARQYARSVLRGRLTISNEEGAWDLIVDEPYDRLLALLRIGEPELESFEMVSAADGELAVADPGAPVAPCWWNGMWFRSRSEQRVAEALEAANVLFAPNPSVRAGITPDHRQSFEPDFLVFCDHKLGVLEVDGPWHHGRAADDAERDRRFKEHGVRVVERYPAERCYSMPGDVVADFIRLLRLNG